MGLTPGAVLLAMKTPRNKQGDVLAPGFNEVSKSADSTSHLVIGEQQVDDCGLCMRIHGILMAA